MSGQVLHDKAASDQMLFQRMGLVDAKAPEAFNAITRLALQIFKTPVSLISVVQEEQDRQFFTSQIGLPDDVAARRQTPLSHSFCQHVKRAGQPLVVNDARKHPLVKNNLAVHDMEVIAYLGVPILGPGDAPLGALCVIENEPRVWTDDDVSILQDLAICVCDEIRLRHQMLEYSDLLAAVRQRQNLTVAITTAFSAPNLSMEQRFDAMLKASCELFETSSAILARANYDEFQTVFAYQKGDMNQGDVCTLEQSGVTLSRVGRQVAAQQESISIHDATFYRGASEDGIGCYLGCPMFINGTFFGVLEFHRKAPRATPWSDTDIVVLNMIGQFAAAEMSAFDRMEALKRSEDELLQKLYHNRKNLAAS
ncbi:GAF domain-containing protein [Pacificibacter maritimus]|uniref:GAF domain-containing protein n=1 Tax=Pacificibacter maritimus TaxID=762213 RepID=A0A3N4U433_9RHOB|nr:GAF domain-containing protein [Pacificibacter maritimus]RPE63075.1 GAF domain-containing protein [Pacificibacter maritimus]